MAAIAAAEHRYGLPPDLLRAIGDVESGRAVRAGTGVQPWPWTANAQGQGLFFDSVGQATAWVRKQQLAGVQSIDVGCLQVNLLHHPDAFQSLEQAFDPTANADYAARFLLKLYRAAGSWMTAVGYYHSQTDGLAEPYRSRVRLAWGHPARSCRPVPTALQMAWQATLNAGSPPVVAHAAVPDRLLNANPIRPASSDPCNNPPGIPHVFMKEAYRYGYGIAKPGYP